MIADLIPKALVIIMFIVMLVAIAIGAAPFDVLFVTWAGQSFIN